MVVGLPVRPLPLLSPVHRQLTLLHLLLRLPSDHAVIPHRSTAWSSPTCTSSGRRSPRPALFGALSKSIKACKSMLAGCSAV